MRPRGSLFCFALLLALAAAPAFAAPGSGDLYVISQSATAQRVVRIDPTTGAQQLVSANGLLTLVETIAQGPDGYLYVQNPTEIIRIDPCSGAQSLLAPNLSTVTGFNAMAAHSDGFLYYTSNGGGVGKVVRLDVGSGAQTIVSSGGQFATLYGIVEGPDHALYIASYSSTATPCVIRVDRSSGAQTVVTTSPPGLKPWGVTFDVRDTLYTLSTADRRVFRVDGLSGASGPLTSPDGYPVFWLVAHADGALYYTHGNTVLLQGEVMRVDPLTGATTLCSSAGLLGLSGFNLTVAHAACATPAERPTWGELKSRYR